jgi:polyphosphate kinase
MSESGNPPKKSPTYGGGIDERFFNRDLSWLAFNGRVLALAADRGVPLLERVKFAAIFTSNLDEFFQVRVASLKNQIDAGVGYLGVDGRSAARLASDLADKVRDLLTQQTVLLATEILPHLRDEGIDIVRWNDLEESDRAWLGREFEQRIFPILTPLVVDPSHPFPYISSLALNVAVIVRDPEDPDEERFARIKVPQLLPRLVALPGRDHFVPLEDLIIAHLPQLFEGMEIVNAATFRVTRDADLDVDDEEVDDLLEAVEAELRRRRFGRAVRLEHSNDMPADVLALLVDELELDATDVFSSALPLDLACLFQIAELQRVDLRDESWPSVTAGRLAAAAEQGRSIFSVIRHRDLMVHHPYESFATSTEDFIAQAAQDPRVQSIKVTLYRTSPDSAIAKSLIEAAERGVQVVALIELKARFDEAVNVNWARQLERAGVHVMYGIVGLKTHAKCALIVRSEPDGIRRYVHFGTGNYNSKTAGTYEDIGVFTCDPELASDANRLFNHLTGFSKAETYSRLVVAPRHLRGRMLELIRQEAEQGPRGLIRMKLNALADPEMIEALYDASRAGATISIVVRGVCMLRPGVKGMSENIEVRSVLGRYLEHSRLYHFGSARGRGEGGRGSEGWFIGSADMMTRNLDRRVEVLVPVLQERHCEWLNHVLEDLEDPDVPHFTLTSDGTWERGGRMPFAADAQHLIHLWARGEQLRRSITQV